MPPPVPMLAIALDAGHDRNGNPRRGWLVVDAAGDALIFIAEGYGGYEELDRCITSDGALGGAKLPRTGTFYITPESYLELERYYEPGGEHCRFR